MLGITKTEASHDKALSAAQVQTLKDLHRGVKGTYCLLTQMMDDLGLLVRQEKR